jgi:hypothetical protein
LTIKILLISKEEYFAMKQKLTDGRIFFHGRQTDRILFKNKNLDKYLHYFVNRKLKIRITRFFFLLVAAKKLNNRNKTNICTQRMPNKTKDEQQTTGGL